MGKYFFMGLRNLAGPPFQAAILSLKWWLALHFLFKKSHTSQLQAGSSISKLHTPS